MRAPKSKAATHRDYLYLSEALRALEHLGAELGSKAYSKTWLSRTTREASQLSQAIADGLGGEDVADLRIQALKAVSEKLLKVKRGIDAQVRRLESELASREQLTLGGDP